MIRVSGYGQTGPYSNRAGDGGIGEAMGGIAMSPENPTDCQAAPGFRLAILWLLFMRALGR